MINRIINSIDTVNKVIDIAEFNPVLEAIVIPDNKNAKPHGQLHSLTHLDLTIQPFLK